MRLTVDLETFEVTQQGFVPGGDGPRRLYLSPGASAITAVEQLAACEYAQAVEVDRAERTVAFGRDYLGHYPLAYACTRRHLHIGDDVTALVEALRADGVEPSVSPEALALYFTAGFVPHGMSIHPQIVNCESACLYRWESGSVRRTSVFRAVEPDDSFPLAALGEAIEREVEKCARLSDTIDVWCSGGLDSSIMAWCFNNRGRRADLVTLAYGAAIQREHGDGERRYARQMADALGAPLRDVDLTADNFDEMHSLFVRSFNTPVIDLPPAPKFALARGSRDLVITGEGGDNLFGGPKNNDMMYWRAQNPSAPLGWLLALAHRRFAAQLPAILRRGDELRAWVTDYFDALLASYPGDLVRKLFYVNTLFKPGSMILAQSYYPARLYGLTVRHPLFALAVHDAAFSLPDRRKYAFPATKIALLELYGDRLPRTIVGRRKSGTQVPLAHYMKTVARAKLDFASLADSGLFRDEFLEAMSEGIAQGARDENALALQYGLVTLNAWLQARRAGSRTDATARERRPRAVLAQASPHPDRAAGAMQRSA